MDIEQGLPRTAEQYEQALVKLLPPGVAWPREPGTVLRAWLRVFAEGVARLHARALDLLEEADPRTTNQLLPEWEHFLGLPEACSPDDQSFAERRDAVVSKFIRIGGASSGYFIALAAELGYTVTIREYGPENVSDPLPGYPQGSDEWAHAWEVTAPQDTIRYFRAGEGRAGERLRNWGNEELECVFGELKPAHTEVLFVYV